MFSVCLYGAWFLLNSYPNVRYLVERATDQEKKKDLKDLISKENLTKLVKYMEYDTDATVGRRK